MMMYCQRKRNKTGGRHMPTLQKSRLWPHAGVEHHISKHSVFFPGNLETGPSVAVPRPRRHKSVQNQKTLSKGLDISESLEDVQFRRLLVPSSEDQDESYDGSAEHTPLRPRRTSNDFIWTDTNLWYTNTGWNVSRLLELSDAVRATLSRGNKLPPSELEELTIVLRMLLVDELDHVLPLVPHSPRQKITLSAIRCACLDKLTADMLSVYDKNSLALSSNAHFLGMGFRSEIENARHLQKCWRARFKSEYLSLDRKRLHDLLTGTLRNISFSGDGIGIWAPKKALEVSEAEVSASLVPGHWWLNVACANRDGVVCDVLERPAKGGYGVVMLPLLSGNESDLPDGKVIYTHMGTQQEMYYGVIPQVGQTIRVLRGFRLKSVYAPKAGLRYDGFYAFRSWSLKLDQTTEIYTQRLILERIPGQKPLDEVLQIPKPSQLDEWALCDDLEKERIRSDKRNFDLRD